MHHARQCLLALSVASALVLPSVGNAHDDDRFDYEATSAKWWQWALSIPTSVNPLTDSTGAHCMVGQRGALWFLAGNFGVGAVTRHCSVPAGVTLFFPVVNSVQVNTPGICGQTGPLSVKEMRANSAAFIDGVTSVTLTLDSRPVHKVRRVRSEPFVTVLPADNLFVAPCNGDSPAGVYGPSVDDGYYARLEHLSPGRHVLQFTAKNASANFDLNITYVLDVIRTQGPR
jgi:hypothetical protein